MDFTEQQQIIFLEERGYTIGIREEWEQIHCDHVKVFRREATKDGQTVPLETAFRNEMKTPLLLA